MDGPGSRASVTTGWGTEIDAEGWGGLSPQEHGRQSIAQRTGHALHRARRNARCCGMQRSCKS